MEAYPTFTRAERIADGAVHALGVVFAVCATVAVVWLSVPAGAATVTAAAVYGTALTACLAASAFYHMTPWTHLRPTLRKIDHACIYLKIAGTYTPLVVILGTGLAYGLLGIVWALALIGFVAKVVFWRTPGRFGPLLYVAMGWMCVLIIAPLAQSVPTSAIWLIVIGGLTYSLGVVFYSAENLRFSMAIWHAFVLAASICFFVAIAVAIVHS